MASGTDAQPMTTDQNRIWLAQRSLVNARPGVMLNIERSRALSSHACVELCQLRCVEVKRGTYVEQDLEDEGSKDGGTCTEDGLAQVIVLAVAFLAEVTAVGTINDNDELEDTNR